MPLVVSGNDNCDAVYRKKHIPSCMVVIAAACMGGEREGFGFSFGLVSALHTHKRTMKFSARGAYTTPRYPRGAAHCASRAWRVLQRRVRLYIGANKAGTATLKLATHAAPRVPGARRGTCDRYSARALAAGGHARTQRPSDRANTSVRDEGGACSRVLNAASHRAERRALRDCALRSFPARA
eukprot:IDg16158t1